MKTEKQIKDKIDALIYKNGSVYNEIGNNRSVLVHTHTAAVQDPDTGLFEGRVGPLITGRR